MKFNEDEIYIYTKLMAWLENHKSMFILIKAFGIIFFLSLLAGASWIVKKILEAIK